MIMYNNIILVIVTIAIFFHGFYFGRRQTLRFLILSLVLLLASLTGIILHGVYISDVIMTWYDVIIAIAYFVFWWGCGYYISVELNLNEMKKFLENCKL